MSDKATIDKLKDRIVQLESELRLAKSSRNTSLSISPDCEECSNVSNLADKNSELCAEKERLKDMVIELVEKVLSLEKEMPEA